MAIKELKIYGYRSFKSVRWRPGKLNLLVGRNASGKSNLLRLLHLISQTAAGRMYDTINASGGMHSLFWNHEVRTLGWSLRIDTVDEKPEPEDILIYRVDLLREAASGDYMIGEDIQGKWNELKGPDVLYGRLSPLFPGNQESPSIQEDFETNDIPVRVYRFLRSWLVFQHISTLTESRIRTAHSQGYSYKLNDNAENLTIVLRTLYTKHPEFRQSIDDGMRAALGEEFEKLVFRTTAREHVEISVKWASSRDPHSSLELSDGTLRFLAILTALADPDPPPLIAIDNPETGLHPSMLPIIAEYAISAAEETQVVISSHSPEFLDYFTLDDDPHVTVFRWKDGQSKICDIPQEKLSEWLDKYRLGEMFLSGELELLAEPMV
jgi:predicted ATPase